MFLCILMTNWGSIHNRLPSDELLSNDKRGLDLIVASLKREASLYGLGYNRVCLCVCVVCGGGGGG